MENLVENPLVEDVSEIIGLHIKDNLIIQERLAKNDDKFDKLLQVVQDMKSPPENVTADATPTRYSDNDLIAVENQIKEIAAENITLNKC